MVLLLFQYKIWGSYQSPNLSKPALKLNTMQPLISLRSALGLLMLLSVWFWSTVCICATWELTKRARSPFPLAPLFWDVLSQFTADLVVLELLFHLNNNITFLSFSSSSPSQKEISSKGKKASQVKSSFSLHPLLRFSPYSFCLLAALQTILCLYNCYWQKSCPIQAIIGIGTCVTFLRNLYGGQEATVRTLCGNNWLIQDWERSRTGLSAVTPLV